VPEFTLKRYGELSSGVLVLLSKSAEGLPAREVLDRLADLVPPTPFEIEDWPKFPGVRRYEKTVRFSTIALVKAGWLIKSAGIWTITPKGLEALKEHGDPLTFYREANKLYREWRKGQPKEALPLEADEPSDVGFGLEQARDLAWEEIRAHLGSMPPYDFQQLVGALLRAMGYHVAWIAPPGADGGIDILAYSDPLGAWGRVSRFRSNDSTQRCRRRACDRSSASLERTTSGSSWARAGSRAAPRPRLVANRNANSR